ncbi:MAG: hypothetical protein SGARI_007659 [Bacillariaceae sp.]
MRSSLTAVFFLSNNSNMSTDGKLSGAAAKVLNTAAAWKVKYGEDLERKQVSAIAEIPGASTVRKAFAALKKLGLITVTATHVVVTPRGMDEADASQVELADRPTTNAEVLEQRKKDVKLTQKELDVVNFIADGNVYTMKSIADACFDGKQNSTLRKLKASLKSKGLVEYVDSGLQLHKNLFPFGGGRPE